MIKKPLFEFIEKILKTDEGDDNFFRLQVLFDTKILNIIK